MARPSSQLGGVNPRIVRDAQSQSAVKQQDLTIDKAEDQLGLDVAFFLQSALSNVAVAYTVQSHSPQSPSTCVPSCGHQ